MVSEHNLRDYLADHLDLVEPGLTLVDTEFELPNPQGSKGLVAIFAWDRVGHLVVIELKISDKTARKALHEVHKYIAFLRSFHGLPDHRLRCLVLSTEWRELLVPFSEYSRGADYPVEGRSVTLDDHGAPTRLEVVEPLAEPEVLQSSPYACMLFYENKDPVDRDLSVEELVSRANDLGIADYCLLSLDKPENFGQAATFAIYGAIAKLSMERKIALANQIGSLIEKYRDDSDDWMAKHVAMELLTRDVFSAQFEVREVRKRLEVRRLGRLEVRG